MLEFAYTGEVNVAQELLPSLLHTAKSFRIKGLDKVENPVDPGPITRVNKTYYLTTLCPDPYKLIFQIRKLEFWDIFIKSGPLIYQQNAILLEKITRNLCFI